jgi:hypothetical protein
MEPSALFALLDPKNKVVNVTVRPEEYDEKIFNEGAPEGYHFLQYSVGNREYTNNEASIGSTYNSDLNAFVPDRPPEGETYVFNLIRNQWEPDPNLVYYPYENAIKHKFDPVTGSWIQEPFDEEDLNDY